MNLPERVPVPAGRHAELHGRARAEIGYEDLQRLVRHPPDDDPRSATFVDPADDVIACHGAVGIALLPALRAHSQPVSALGVVVEEDEPKVVWLPPSPLQEGAPLTGRL